MGHWTMLGAIVVLLQSCAWGAADAPPAVTKQGEQVNKWLMQLSEDDVSLRAAAAKELGRYLRGPEPPVRGFSDLPRKDDTPDPPEVKDAELDAIAKGLGIAIADKDEEVRKAAAMGLASVPRKTAAVERALRAGLESPDRVVRWYVVQSMKELRPDVKEFVPVLLRRMKEDAQDAWFYAWAIGDYGAAARFAAPELAGLLSHSEKEIRQWAGAALRNMGVDLETAKGLVDARLRFDPAQAGDVFVALLSQPREAVRFAEKHPEMGQELGRLVRFVYAYLCKSDEDAAQLAAGLGKVKKLPPLIMGLLRDERFLPLLDAQLKDADTHTRAMLEACARACGRAPQRIVKISKDQKGNFRPDSARSGGDEKRMPKDMRGHGDGYTWVLVTGTLRMADGTPARRPKFFAVNDRMMLGLEDGTPEPILYEQKTGKFVFMTTVFAAYAMQEGAAESGPYQTGSALTRIEADGAEPLQVRFFDEMPHVEITLTAGEGRKPETRPVNRRRNNGVIGGFMPPPSRD